MGDRHPEWVAVRRSITEGFIHAVEVAVRQFVFLELGRPIAIVEAEYFVREMSLGSRSDACNMHTDSLQ
jgi:hypothetical protein